MITSEDRNIILESHPGKCLRWFLPLLAIWGSVTGCSLFSDSEDSDTDGAVAAQTSTALAVQESLDNLSILGTQTAQAVQPTTTPIQPSPFPTFTLSPPTHTPTLPTVVLPTNPTGWVNKIRFPSGGTSAFYQKSIKPGEQHLYNIRALKDQTLIVIANSPDSDVYLGVRGLDGGEQLLWASDKVTSWFGTLPQNQVYQISLTTNNLDTFYFLLVEVPGTIRFKTGAYSDSVNGYIEVDSDFYPAVITRVRYQAFAFAGQTMTVKLTSPNLDDLALGIEGQQDGQVYLDFDEKNTAVELVLPATQAYYLDVYAINGISTTFTLEIFIK
jgi:hypothetical protein